MPDDILNQDAVTLEITKALTTTSSSGMLVPEAFETGIRDYTLRNSPLYNFFEKRDWPSAAVSIKKLTALPTAASYAEMAALQAASNSVWGENVFTMKNIHVRGEISGQLMAQSGGQFENILDIEVRHSARALINKIEALAVSGDSAVTATDFDGLLKQITNIKYFDSVGNGTGTDTLLTLGMIDEGLDFATEPSTTAIIMNRAMHRRILALVSAMVRYIPDDSIDINAGVRVPTYNGIPILRPAVDVSGLNNKIICVNGEEVRFYVNMPITYEPLSKTKDSVDYFLKTYMLMAVEGPNYYHTVIQGVKAA